MKKPQTSRTSIDIFNDVAKYCTLHGPSEITDLCGQCYVARRAEQYLPIVTTHSAMIGKLYHASTKKPSATFFHGMEKHYALLEFLVGAIATGVAFVSGEPADIMTGDPEVLKNSIFLCYMECDLYVRMQPEVFWQVRDWPCYQIVWYNSTRKFMFKFRREDLKSGRLERCAREWFKCRPSIIGHDLMLYNFCIPGSKELIAEFARWAETRGVIVSEGKWYREGRPEKHVLIYIQIRDDGSAMRFLHSQLRCGWGCAVFRCID